MSGSVKSGTASFAFSATGSVDTGVSGNTLYHSLHAQIKRNESGKSVSSASEKSDPRRLLSKYYNLESNIPSDVSGKVFAQNTNVMSDKNSNNNNNATNPTERDFLEQVIQDTKKYSKEQREQIAHSVLTGSYEVKEDDPHRDDGKVANPLKRANEIQRTKEKLLYLQRHNLPKPHFLELATETAHVPILDPSILRQEKLKMMRNRTVEHTLAHVRLEPGLDWHNAIANTITANKNTARPQSNRSSSRPTSATVITKNGIIEITDEMPKTPMVNSDGTLSKSMSIPTGTSNSSGSQRLASSFDGSMKGVYSKLIMEDKM